MRTATPIRPPSGPPIREPRPPIPTEQQIARASRLALSHMPVEEAMDIARALANAARN